VILIDSHILLGVLNLTDFKVPPDAIAALEVEDRRFVSVASIWELAIKFYIGRLDLRAPPNRMPDMLRESGFKILDITPEHALAGAKQQALTKDPFDRLLLGVCQVEKMKLMTLDQALVDHPLAWKPKRRRSAK
jgi:PIN domain nuclease of toxin-antitoxin system